MPVRPHRVALWALPAYLGLLAAVALWPQPVDRPVAGLLRSTLRWLHHSGVPGWVDYSLVESTANVLLFIPLGFLVTRLAGRGFWWLGTAAGLLTSCAIEAAQFLFLPDRYPTAADVLANTLGALLGTLLAALLERRRT